MAQLKACSTRDRVRWGRDPHTCDMLLPVELITDLNNDGEISNSDTALQNKPYEQGATQEDIDKGTEFLFANDDVSNGLWDKEDGDAPGSAAEDDDVEELKIRISATFGDAWLEHPAIDEMTFYETRECTTEVDIKASSPHSLSTSGAIHSPIYIRVDGDPEFPEEDPQISGDLILKYRPSATGQVVDAAKLKLTIVEGIGATKHHLAAIDYIGEQNTTHFTDTVTYSRTGFDPEVPYVCMLEDRTELRGINAALGPHTTIHSLVGASAWSDMTALLNGNFAHLPSGADGNFFSRHTGLLHAGGSPDPTASIASSIVGLANARYIAYGALAGGGSGWVWGSGDVPANAAEAMGGMRVPGASTEPFTSVARLHVADKKLIIVASDFHLFWTDGVYPDYEDDIEKGADLSKSTLLMADGGSSTALAVKDPDGTAFEVKTDGLRHKILTPGLRIKTYFGFKSTKPRP